MIVEKYIQAQCFICPKCRDDHHRSQVNSLRCKKEQKQNKIDKLKEKQNGKKD